MLVTSNGPRRRRIRIKSVNCMDNTQNCLIYDLLYALIQLNAALLQADLFRLNLWLRP